MYSYPEVHSTVPGWLLALLSVALGAVGVLAELLPARGRRCALRVRALLAAAAAVDAAESVAYAIAMTMWLKRYTGVPRPNFAASCHGTTAADGHIECSTKHGACCSADPQQTRDTPLVAAHRWGDYNCAGAAARSRLPL